MKGAPDDESKNLLLAQIEHKTYEQLSELEIEVMQAIEKTREQSQASDANWELQYDALCNLRKLNKFHFSVMTEELIDSD
jgi:hypothetical protein